MKLEEEFCSIDFETYSEHDIKFGALRYAQDKSTEVICMAYKLPDKHIQLWVPSDEPPLDFLDYISRGGLIRAWNAGFEYAILKYCCTRLYGWPEVKIKQMRDSAADALALALPSQLAMCAEALGTSEQKDKRGKLLITKLSKPRKPTKNKPYTRITPEIEPELFQEFYEYCIQDVKTELSIYNMLPRDVVKDELDLFHLTMEINERGLPIDYPLVSCLISARTAYEKTLNEEVYQVTNGQLTSTNSRAQALDWLSAQGVLMDGYTKGDVKAALSKNLPDNARRFLEIRSEMSRTPIKKYDFIESAICKDSTIKNNIVYHKATTGRYAGSGFQIQNLPRDSHPEPEQLIEKFMSEEWADMNIYDEAIKLIRNVITAPPGKKLVVSDFSSIENRVLAWLAGDYETLLDFKQGKDQYKTAASSIYKVTYDAVNKDQRQLGKIAVLSCGFGGGHKTFRRVCSEQWGIKISEEQAKDIVDGWREKYWKVKNMWYGLYDAAIDCITHQKVTQYGLIKFRVMGDFLYMRLPSGRLLAYYKPELRMVTTPWGAEKLAITHMGTNTYTRKWERLTVIPGRLTENAVQAVARDFLTEAMVRVEKAGYKVIASVHDEIISLVDEDFGSIEEFDKLMAVNPAWGLDCPIDVEGYEARRYRK